MTIILKSQSCRFTLGLNTNQSINL